MGTENKKESNPTLIESPSKLFLISFSILFLELAAIRWLNSSVTVLGYFNNLILISCFLGLGVGCLLSTRNVSLIRAYPYAFLFFVVCVGFLDQLNITISYQGDVIFNPSPEFYSLGLLRVSFSALLGFFINVAFFIILGQELGRQLNGFKESLRAYAYDIGGSFMGVLAYTLLAWFQTPPPIWYGVGVLLLLVFIPNRKQKLMALGAVGIGLFIMTTTYDEARWSPYYKVETQAYENEENKNLGYKINVDNLRIQDAIRFSPELLKTPLRWWVPYYQLPYLIKKPEKVLILGAGSGNEVVFALQNGAKIVHAVEIDPVIADFGKTLHPHKPYLDSRVKIFVDDARSFISKTREKYDLIVMSALDSHRQIAGMSSLRLESFIYTREAYAQIKRILGPNGVFCLNLSSGRPWMGERTFWSLTEAFGREPTVLTSPGSPFDSVAYVFASYEEIHNALNTYSDIIRQVPPPTNRTSTLLSTDNWPYLYLQKNRIPNACLIVLIVMLVAASIIVLRVEPAVKNPNLHFFFLGAGFMLLETRSVTQMAQLFGSTWNVNAVVFGSIFLTILISNFLVIKKKSPANPISYGLLAITLIGGYFFPFEILLTFTTPLRLIVAGGVIGLPIIFASFIFSTSFKAVEKINVVFGSNLLGIVFGGCVEYTTNIWGLNNLYLLALLIYGASCFFLKSSKTL